MCRVIVTGCLKVGFKVKEVGKFGNLFEEDCSVGLAPLDESGNSVIDAFVETLLFSRPPPVVFAVFFGWGSA